jgi:adenylate cyclase
MSLGPMIVSSFSQSIAQNRIDIHSDYDIGLALLATSASFPTDIVYYGGEDQRFIANTEPRSLTYNINHTLEYYNVHMDADFQNYTLSFNRTVPGFQSVTERPWYKAAKNFRAKTWSSIFLTVTDFLAISMCSPLFEYTEHRDKIFTGVFAAQIRLSGLNVYINRTLQNTKSTSLAFIMERNGNLVASSFNPIDSDSTRINATEVDGPIGVASRRLFQLGLHNNRTLSYTSLITFNRHSYNFQASVYEDQYNLDWIIGVIVLRQKFWSSIFKSSIVLIVFSIASIIFGTVMVLAITQAITSPLYKIKKELINVSNFKMKQKIFRVRSPFFEVRTIQDSVLTLTHSLKSFQKFVPRVVCDRIIQEKKPAQLGMTEENISVFFSDIADFTKLSEDTMNNPTILLTVVGEYFEEMSDMIEKNLGLIDKYIGDAIMALFVEKSNHHLYAVQAALDCSARMKELRASWKERSLPELRIRMGVNSGNALIGNLGSHRRLNFTAIGDAVNLASRLESINKLYGTDILIGSETYEHVNQVFLCEYVSFVAVKGKDQPLKVYRPVCLVTEATEEILCRKQFLQNIHDSFFGYSFDQCLQYCKQLMLILQDDLKAENGLSYEFVNGIMSAANKCIKYKVQQNDPIHTIMYRK